MSDPRVFLYSDVSVGKKNPWRLPSVTLVVTDWPDAPPEGVQGVKVTIWECDYGGHDDVARASNAAPTSKQEVASLTFDLTPVENVFGDGWAISRAKLTQAYWDFKLRKAKELPTHDDRGESQNADFALHLGGDVFMPLRVPLDKGTFHDEGRVFELGFTLEHGAVKLESLDAAVTNLTLVPADIAGRMIESATRPMGAALADGDYTKTQVLGRFNDPRRNPHLDPTPARQKLDQAIKDALSSGGVVDVDGLRFENFCKPDQRRALIQDTLGPRIKHSKLGDEAPAGWKHDDIAAAYFVLHDIGSGIGWFDPNRFTAANAPKGKGVHGYMNKNGTYGFAKDFSEVATGTKYQSTKMGRWARWNCLNIEMVPQPELKWEDHEEYPYVGWKKEDGKIGYWKWSHELVNAMADLYVLASARANHLLTITAHVEVDRNLVFSGSYWEYSEKEMRTLAGKYEMFRKAFRQPDSMHGDPYGLDLQVLYDKISEKLSALGGLPLPRGARYGINPERLIDRVNTMHGLAGTISNRSDQLHTFPHQSAPASARLGPGATAKVNGWKKNLHFWES